MATFNNASLINLEEISGSNSTFIHSYMESDDPYFKLYGSDDRYTRQSENNWNSGPGPRDDDDDDDDDDDLIPVKDDDEDDILEDDDELFNVDDDEEDEDPEDRI